MFARIYQFAINGSTLRKHLISAAMGSVLVNIYSKALMLLISIILARWLGATGYGIYASAMAIVLLLVVPATLGLPTFVVRFTASYGVRQEWGRMRGLLIRGGWTVFALSVFVAASGAALVWFVGEDIGSKYTHALWWAMALLPLLALTSVCSAALRGLDHVVLGQMSESIVLPTILVLLLLFFHHALADGKSVLAPDTAMAAQVLAAGVALAMVVWLLLRNLPDHIRRARAQYDYRGWVRASLPLVFLGGMVTVNAKADVIMLAMMDNPHAAGVYQAANRGAELVAFPLIMVSMAIQPTISRLYATNELQRLQRILTLVARGAMLLAIPLALIFSVFGAGILGTVFGTAFESGASALAILSAAQVVSASAGPVALILNMTGHEKSTAFGMVLAAVSNVLLNSILIPPFGLEGAAVATGISLVAWNVILTIVVRKRLGLDPTALGVRADKVAFE